MQFSPAAFNGLLVTIGQAVAWRSALTCPCRNPYSGAADMRCPVCTGAGVTWDNPIAAWTGLAGQRASRQFAAFGQWEEGDVALTIPSDSPLYAIARNDRVLFTQSSQPYDLVILPDNGDRMVFIPISVDRCVFIADGQIIDADLPSVGADGSLVWDITQLRPPAGTQYTIAGRRHPEYFCFTEVPQDRAHNMGLPLPRKVQIRKFSLFNLSGAPGVL